VASPTDWNLASCLVPPRRIGTWVPSRPLQILEIGFRLGAPDGLELGLRLGPPHGLELGLALGCSDGLELGFQLGRSDGLELCFMLGAP